MGSCFVSFDFGITYPSLNGSDLILVSLLCNFAFPLSFSGPRGNDLCLLLTAFPLSGFSLFIAKAAAMFDLRLTDGLRP